MLFHLLENGDIRYVTLYPILWFDCALFFLPRLFCISLKPWIVCSEMRYIYGFCGCDGETSCSSGLEDPRKLFYCHFVLFLSRIFAMIYSLIVKEKYTGFVAWHIHMNDTSLWTGAVDNFDHDFYGFCFPVALVFGFQISYLRIIHLVYCCQAWLLLVNNLYPYVLLCTIAVTKGQQQTTVQRCTKYVLRWWPLYVYM